MMSNHRKPVWPYLILLGALFVLSVTAPRRWQERPMAHQHTAGPKSSRLPPPSSKRQAIVLHPTLKRTTAADPMSAVQPAAESALAHLSPFEAGPVSPPPQAQSAFDQVVGPGDESDEEPADPNGSRSSDESSFVSLREAPTDEETASAAAPDNLTAETISVAERGEHAEQSPAQDAANDTPPKPDYELWPMPHALVERLEELQAQGAFAAWVGDVRASIDQLAALRLDDPASSELLRRLRGLLANSPAREAEMADDVRREGQQAEFDLLRRLNVWDRVAAAAAQHAVALQYEEADAAMLQAVAGVNGLCASSPIGSTWRRFLLLDQLERLAGDGAPSAERTRVARIVLARLADSRLSREQRRFLARGELAILERRLRGWTIERLELGPLVHTVEEYESAQTSSLARALAEQTEIFVDSSKPVEQRVGRELSRQYSNANLRVVLTREFVNRLLPRPQVSSDVVNETIVGVPSRGFSTTSARLGLRFFPARDQLRLGIEAAGNVESQTSSTAGPVTFLSQGESNYRVGKLVVVDRDGIRVGRAMAEANNQTRLAGIETDFDGFPLVRNIVRGYALSQHDEKQGQARLEVEAKVATRAEERFDAEINGRLLKAENDFRTRVLAPFEKLGLDHTVVQLKTSEDRLTARLRLGNRDQLGAHTPRPLAMSNSLASLQIHESAFNNALERFELAGRTFTLPELHQWIAGRLGRVPVKVPDDLPDNVVVTFADEDPIRVRCYDGQVDVTLAFAELDQGERAWHDFEITVHFKPRYEGLRLEFSREGSIELRGEGHTGRVEVVLRGIFAKVFSQRRKVLVEPRIPPDRPDLAKLEFSSAVVDNGWISVTVADRAAE